MSLYSKVQPDEPVSININLHRVSSRSVVQATLQGTTRARRQNATTFILCFCSNTSRASQMKCLKVHCVRATSCNLLDLSPRDVSLHQFPPDRCPPPSIGRLCVFLSAQSKVRPAGEGVGVADKEATAFQHSVPNATRNEVVHLRQETRRLPSWLSLLSDGIPYTRQH